MHSNQRLAKLKRSPVDFYLLTLNKLQSLVRVLDVTEKYSANFFTRSWLIGNLLINKNRCEHLWSSAVWENKLDDDILRS